MVLLSVRCFLLPLSLPLLAVAAPNQRRTGDQVYGDDNVPTNSIYYAQTSTAKSYSQRPEAIAPSTLKTLPNASTLPSGGFAGNTYEMYGSGSSSIGRYPTYNSTATYGSGGAWLPGTGSMPQATQVSSIASEQACLRDEGYAVTTSTQTTMVTDTQTVTTVVTSTQTVTSISTSTSVMTSTSTITAYVTVTATSAMNHGTGSPIQNTGEAPYSYFPKSLVPGAAYPSSGIPIQSQLASVGDYASIPTSAPTKIDQIQPQPSSAGGFLTSGLGFGSAAQSIPPNSIPISQGYGNFSIPPSAGLPISQISSLAYASEGVSSSQQVKQQPLPSVIAPTSAPNLYPVTGGVPYASGSVPANALQPSIMPTAYSMGSSSNIPSPSKISPESMLGNSNVNAVPSQQQPESSYNVPSTNAPITSQVASPALSTGANPYPAISTGANPYQSQNEGLGPEIPSTMPPFMNETHTVSSGVPQSTTSAAFPSYQIGPSLAGTAGFSFPDTGGTVTMVSTYHVIPVPATSVAPFSGKDAYHTKPIYTANNFTTSSPYGAYSSIPIMSISNPVYSILPTGSKPPAAGNTSAPVPPVSALPQETSEIVPSGYSPASLPNLDSSQQISPETTTLPSNPAAILPTSIPTSPPTSIPLIQSSCAPTTSTITLNNFQNLPSTAPLPIPYMGLNYTTFTPNSAPPYSHLLSSSLPHVIAAPDATPHRSFTMLSLLLSCYPPSSDQFCTVDLTGLAMPTTTASGAAAGGIARMSINVPPSSATGGGNGTDGGNGTSTVPGVNGTYTVPGVNGGTVPTSGGKGVGVPVAFTGQGWTGLRSVSFSAELGGPWGDGNGQTGVGVDEFVYIVVDGCG